MAVGLNPSQQEINTQAGVVIRNLHAAIRAVREFKYFLDGKTDDDLIALGYTAAEVTTLRSAYGDLNQLAAMYGGAIALPVAKDFRTFARRLFGLGDV